MPERGKRVGPELISERQQGVRGACDECAVMETIRQIVSTPPLRKRCRSMMLDEWTRTDDVGIAVTDLCTQERLACAIGVLIGFDKGVDDVRQHFVGIHGNPALRRKEVHAIEVDLGGIVGTIVHEHVEGLIAQCQGLFECGASGDERLLACLMHQ